MPDVAPSSFAHRVAAGAVWMGSARLLVRAIGLVSTIVLARLLVPDDFGLVALASALLFVIETLSDLRFEQAIIAQRDTHDSDFDTAFTLNLIRGAVVALVIALIAYPYALMMDDSRLASLLLALAAVPLIAGVKNPAFVTYEKSMSYWREFTLQLVHKLTTFVVTVTLAWLWRDYWALVAGIVTGALVRVAGSYLMHPYRPRLGLAAWRRLAAFSSWLIAANTINAVAQKFELFVLGAFLPVRTVGIYHVGSEVSAMATHEIALPIKRVLFPALSALKDESAEQYRRFRQSVQVITAITLPLGVGLALLAEPFVLLVLGEKWTAAVEVIRFLAPLGVVWAIAGLADTLVISAGQTRLIFFRELLRTAILLPLYLVGAWLGGLQGVLIAAVFVALSSMIIGLAMVRQYAGTPLFTPILDTWRSLLACICMALAVGMALPASIDMQGNLERITAIAMATAVGVVIYTACHFLLWLVVGRPHGIESFMLDSIKTMRRRAAVKAP